METRHVFPGFLISYYGPLPATPPAFDLNPRGLPAASPGKLKGYVLWLDPETYTWTLAWSGDGQEHAFLSDFVGLMIDRLCGTDILAHLGVAGVPDHQPIALDMQLVADCRRIGFGGRWSPVD